MYACTIFQSIWGTSNGKVQILRPHLHKKDFRVDGVLGQIQPENNLF